MTPPQKAIFQRQDHKLELMAAQPGLRLPASSCWLWFLAIRRLLFWERRGATTSSGIISEVAQEFLREVQIHCVICPGGTEILPIVDVARLIGLSNEFFPFGLVLKLAHSDLYSHVRREGVLSSADLQQLAMTVFRGLKHIHSRSFVHMDVSAKNVLKFGDQFMLSDFGSASCGVSKTLNFNSVGCLRNGLQTLPYRAPELVACGWIVIAGGCWAEMLW